MILKAVHSKGIIHGDVQPGNLLLHEGGTDPDIKVRLVDFGAATMKGRKKAEEQDIVINYYFASADRIASRLKSELLSVSQQLSHSFYPEPSRVNDLISLAYYTLVLLLRGFLPWGEHLTPSGER